MPPVLFILESKRLGPERLFGYGRLLNRLKDLGYLITFELGRPAHRTVHLPDDNTSRALVLDLLCKIGRGKTADLFQALVVCRAYSDLMRFEVVPSIGDPYRYKQARVYQ